MNRGQTAKSQAQAAISFSIDHQEARENERKERDRSRRLQERLMSGVVMNPHCLLFSDPDHICVRNTGAPIREGEECYTSARMEIEAEAARRARLSDEQRRAEDGAETAERMREAAEWQRERAENMARYGPQYVYVDEGVPGA